MHTNGLNHGFSVWTRFCLKIPSLQVYFKFSMGHDFDKLNGFECSHGLVAGAQRTFELLTIKSGVEVPMPAVEVCRQAD